MKLNAKLYDYQRVGIRFALTHQYCIIGDEMGLGKTLQAIGVAVSTQLPTLIVCPAFMKPVWIREIEKFVKGDLDYKIVSYASLKTSEHLFKDAKIVIADEIHYLKTPSALRTKGFHFYIEKYKPDYLIGLTGTPIKNRVGEFFSLIRLMDRNPHNTNGKSLVKPYHRYTGFQNFFSHQVIKQYHGRQVIQYTGTQNIPILKSILVGKYLRRRAKDVLDLPEVNRLDVPSSKASEDEDIYLKQAWEDFHKDKNTNMSTAKALSANMKTEFTSKYVNQIVDQGESVVVFTDHIESAKTLHELIPDSVMITGNVPMKDRDTRIDKFNTKKAKVLIGTIGTCSVGYTLTVARHVVFNDLPWVPGDLVQAEKRIHRIGQDRKCFIHRVYRSRIDYYINATLTAKVEEIGRIV